MSTVLGLHELGRDDISSRWQSANLGELIKAGFDVPDGFVVATHAYPAALSCAAVIAPRGRGRTGRGTSVLSNGQRVIVDGGSGRVLAYDAEGS